MQAWRRLTTAERARRAGAGEGTLVACSGGADSSALVLALAAAVSGGKAGRARIVVGHVVHDLRPRREAEADRDAARRLAEMVGAEFVEAKVRVREKGGNLEGAARKARYGALVKMAKREGVRFVATAHHADDQLETLLMALMRGAGPRGMAGVRRSRALGGEGAGRVMLIRPMIEAAVERADAERICGAAGWEWREDATNADTTRFRAAVRARLVPIMRELRPGTARRACGTARVMADAARLVDGRAGSVWAMAEERGPGRAVWDRERLRRCAPTVLGEVMRIAASEFIGSGADRMGGRVSAPVIRAIRDDSTEPRRFDVGGKNGLRVDITARTVTIAARSQR